MSACVIAPVTPLTKLPGHDLVRPHTAARPAPDALAAGMPPGLRDDLVALLGADCVLTPAHRSYSPRYRCQLRKKESATSVSSRAPPRRLERVGLLAELRSCAREWDKVG